MVLIVVHPNRGIPLQSITLAPYLNTVRATLTAAMCLQNFGSQDVERHNKPEIEALYVPSYIHSQHLNAGWRACKPRFDDSVSVCAKAQIWIVSNRENPAIQSRENALCAPEFRQ